MVTLISKSHGDDAFCSQGHDEGALSSLRDGDGALSEQHYTKIVLTNRVCSKTGILVHYFTIKSNACTNQCKDGKPSIFLLHCGIDYYVAVLTLVPK